MKSELLDDIGVMLFRKGFIVKQLSRNCFDIIARKEDNILLIKVLEDANAISNVVAEDMKNLSSYINASALIIANKASEPLQNNVVYSRFGVYTLTPKTFENCLENKLPFIIRNNAGLVASVIGERLRKKREEAGYSLGGLSKKLGVSARMIQKYEAEDSEVSFRKAIALYDLFGNTIFNSVDLFASTEQLQKNLSSDISFKYVKLGFDALEIRKALFDIVAKKEKDLILTEVGDRKHQDIASLARLLEANNLIIFKKEKPKEIPALTKEEFMDLKSSKELIKFVKEFE